MVLVVGRDGGVLCFESGDVLKIANMEDERCMRLITLLYLRWFIDYQCEYGYISIVKKARWRCERRILTSGLVQYVLESTRVEAPSLHSKPLNTASPTAAQHPNQLSPMPSHQRFHPSHYVFCLIPLPPRSVLRTHNLNQPQDNSAPDWPHASPGHLTPNHASQTFGLETPN